MIELRKNDSTGIYTLSVQHYSPIFAQKFASLMISEINEHMRTIHQSNIDSRLSFLDQQLAVTKPDELNRALYTLVEQELKRKMMVESEHEYIFRVLEGPLLPVLKSSPRRAFIVIVTTISAVLIAVITLALIFLYRRHSKESA
jgi:LPS O-antigen subunit length determinant protein (WzzB/FepE family)